MRNHFRPLFTIVVFSGILISSCQDEILTSEKIKGIYGSPESFWRLDHKLSQLGVNAVFVHAASINHDLIDKVRSEGAEIYAEFPTLNGKNYVEEHPEAWPIDASGQKVEAASWFMGVCPTEPGFRQYRRNQLENLLLEYELDGVWLDYVHWHAQFEEPEPILPETCFCDHCLKDFSKKKKIKLAGNNTSEKAAFILESLDSLWRAWRCEVIVEWCNEMWHILKTIRPQALLGLYHCPWTDEEFNGARIKYLGLDYDLLTNSIDVFSPMVYHARMGRNATWVKENLEWFYNRIQVNTQDQYQVWPIVQAHDDPDLISAEEFGRVLKYGLEDPATGVMMFTSRSVAENPAKIEVMKNIYSGD